LSGKKRRKPAPSATPWDDLAQESMTPAQALVHAAHKNAYDFRHESFAGDIDFFNQFARDSCPRCGDDSIKRNGHYASGMQRYFCSNCKQTFTPASGTIFESRKLPLSAWVDFLLQLLSFESIAAMTREDRRSDTTIPYWLGKVFVTLDGIQEDMVLKGRVQIDETYYSVPGREAISADGKLLRGLSRNKICIAVGCDDFGQSYFARAGFGKPSTQRVLDAYGSHIERGSHLIHDMEKAHRKLVENLGLNEEVYNSKLISKIDNADDPLSEVNRLCYLLKRFLNSHSGFNRDNLNGYLNLFSVIMNPPENKMEKVVMVLNRAMHSPKTVHFRDYYNLKSSSGR